MIIAGLIGLGIVAIYFIAYYRLLGIVAFISLALSGSLLWVIISLLGATLTLAGLVGIVVSIGVSLDSNVVFYEHLKEDVLHGQSLRLAYLTRSKLSEKRSRFGIPVLYTPAELAEERGPGVPLVPEVEPTPAMATSDRGTL